MFIGVCALRDLFGPLCCRLKSAARVGDLQSRATNPTIYDALETVSELISIA
jgi:hypothetical protein